MYIYTYILSFRNRIAFEKNERLCYIVPRLQNLIFECQVCATSSLIFSNTAFVHAEL